MSDELHIAVATTYEFRCRAECLMDVLEVLGVANSCILNFRLTGNYFAESDPADGWRINDVEVEFNVLKGKTIKDLRADIAQIPDTHVMLETLAPHDQYTGERG